MPQTAGLRKMAGTQLSAESELLIALCRIPLDATSREKIDRLLGGSLNWSVLLDRASEWEVDPIVFSNLLALYSDSISVEVLNEIIVRIRSERARWLLMTQLLTDVLHALKDAGIEVIVLKGPAIAIVAYGDASLRPFRDFDLLVRKEDIPAAREAFLSKGYFAEYDPRIEAWLTKEQIPLEFSNGRTHVDLHWTLFSRNWRLELNVDELWAGARTVECLDTTITVLSPAHLFVFLCAHGAKHRWSVFRWICDLAQLEDGLTEDDIVSLLAVASAARARRIVSLGVHLARAVFGNERGRIPPESLSSDDETRKLVTAVRSAWVDGPPNTRASVFPTLDPALPLLIFWAAARENLWDRVASISRFIAFPSARDAPALPFHWLWRPIRLARTAFRRAAGAGLSG